MIREENKISKNVAGNCVILTDSMEQSPSEANSRSSSQEIQELEMSKNAITQLQVRILKLPQF
jgi:hypothetical protein